MALTGEQLKAKLAELGQVPESTAAIECGYATKAGKAAFAAFRQAQLEAHGLALSKPKTGRKGKPLSFAITAGKAGSIMLASGYASLIGVGPGEQVQIAHHDHQLVITKAGVTPTPTATAEAVVTTAEPIALPVVTYDATPASVEPQLTPF